MNAIDDLPHAGQVARRRHRRLLGVAGLIVCLAAALEVVSDGRVAVRGFSEYPLPHLCMSRAAWGVTCPGCGLTRSFIGLAHGDWSAAWQAHRLGWLLAIVVLFQFPYRLLLLLGRGRALSARATNCFACAVLAALVANWMWGVVEKGW